MRLRPEGGKAVCQAGKCLHKRFHSYQMGAGRARQTEAGENAFLSPSGWLVAAVLKDVPAAGVRAGRDKKDAPEGVWKTDGARPELDA